MSEVRALLLAAGLGTRLRPLTEHCPKCLIPIAGRPLLEHWLCSLHRCGIGQVLVNMHHHQCLVETFLTQPHFSGWVHGVSEDKLLGTAGSLRENGKYLSVCTTLLAHADNWCQCNFHDFLNFHQIHRPANTVITMMTFRTPTPTNCGIVEVDGEGLEFQLQDQGGGRYQGSWAGLTPGSHHYVASAYGNGFIGEDEGRFIVEQHSIESVDVRANTVLLGEIAGASGGRYLALGEWRKMLELLALQKHLVEKSTVVSLWNQRWLVAIVVLLLGSEWFVRKRCGMI